MPAYPPSGEGPFVFLWTEKRGLGTPEVAQALASGLALPLREVSYAGMKDKHSVSRQQFCVPAEVEAQIPAFNVAGVTILSMARHSQKLRTGHLRGNRFSVRIRDVANAEAANAALERLKSVGVPNYFGDQRFGQTQDTAALGKKLLLGQRLSRTPSKFLRKLYLSAFQSLLFNRALANRIQDGTIARALLGDVLRKADTGGLFVCEDPAVDQPRVDGFAVSPAGPIFGTKMIQARGSIAEAEARLLADEGVAPLDFERGRGETLGARRPYRIPFQPTRVFWEANDLLLDFELPKGSYATVLLQEIMKSETDPKIRD
jgi:tRNA pseudouridine13 synthase